MAVRQRILAVLFGLALSYGLAGRAAAQEGTEALGTPIGGFILYPTLDIGTEYNDNIYATDHNTNDDVIFHITPAVRLQSDWDNHSLGFFASGTFDRYVDHTSEDTTGYRFLTDGCLDILQDTYATAEAGIIRSFEERGSPDDVNGEKPTEEFTIAGNLGFYHRFTQTWMDLNGGIAHRDFKDVDATGGGTINNNDRDRVEYTSSARVGYDFNPEVAVFVEGTFNYNDYDTTPDDNGFDRNSKNYSATAGFQFDITNVLYGDLFGGITRSEYDDSSFNNETTWTAGSDLTWDVTELTTAVFTASRSWQETTVDGASSALTTTGGVSLTHSLLDTVTLNSFFNYTREEFEGTNRIDNTYSMGPGVTYLMNRFVHLSLNYTHTIRDSDAADEDYTENVVLFTTRLQY
jgi:hypothetical protein